MLTFQLPGSALGYDNEDCHYHQFLLLKHQDDMQTTKYSLKIKQIYLEWNNLKGIPINLPLLLFYNIQVNQKSNIVDYLKKQSVCSCNDFLNINLQVNKGHSDSAWLDMQIRSQNKLQQVCICWQSSQYLQWKHAPISHRTSLGK